MAKSKNSGYLLKLTLVATLGGLLFGYDTGVISGTVGSLESFFVTPKGLSEGAANAFKGFLVASALIGCIIGGIFGGLISKKLGRKKGLILAAILFLISALGSAMPEMFIKPIGELDHTFSTIFIVYRIIGGIGVVFDSKPEFEAMLQDCLPVSETGEPLEHASALFIDRHATIIASTDENWLVGSTLPIPEALMKIKNGESRHAVTELNSDNYLIGVTCSSGYREYKTTGDYSNDVIAVVMIKM